MEVEILQTDIITSAYLEPANLNPSLNSDYKKDKLDTDSKQMRLV
jgi:hypothetical protein